MKLLIVVQAVLLAVAVVAVGSAQETLNNEGVIKLVKSGVTEDLIVSLIKQQPGAYSLGANDVVALKEAGVSEKIIATMMGRSSGAPATPASASPGAPAAGGVAPRSTAAPDSGIFYKKSGDYLELLTEQVTWKTKGALKNIASAGIVKKDLDGSIQGPSSRNFLTSPLEIVISPPHGLTVSNYVLVPLRQDHGNREFTVGPVNSESGVPKGALAYGVEKVGDRQFRMVFQPSLHPGEYGILVLTPSAKNASQTHIYTFRLLL